MRRLFLISCLLVMHTICGQTTSSGIDTTEIVTIGGIQQFIKIKGKERANPILLYLHGGPGESAMEDADTFTNKLQEYFVVVQWDQRETGHTLELNLSPDPLTVKLMQNDTYELITKLLTMFEDEKLYLVGHSWGNILGFDIADKYPQFLHAYIAISPHIKNSDNIWLDKVKKYEKEKNNLIAVRELDTIQVPFKNFEQLFTARKWLSDFEGDPVPDSMVATYIKMLEPWRNTWFSVVKEVDEIDFSKSLKRVQCPIYFFLGRNDHVTPPTISAHFYKKLKTPEKKLFWMEQSGHLIPTTEPQRLQEIIINSILLKATTK